MTSPPIQTSRPSTAALIGDRRGAAALEFAIVAMPCLGLLLGIFGVSYDFYLQEALDYSLRQAVRQIQIGAVPPGTSAGGFTANSFCPIFSGFAACSGVFITVQPVDDFASAQAVSQSAAASAQSSSFCTGAPGQLMFARAVYLAPLFSQIWPYGTVVSLGGASGNALVADAAFANENPAGTPVPAGGGC